MLSFSDEKVAKEKAEREEKERLLKQKLTAKRAAAAAAEDEKTATGGTPAPVSSESSTAMVIDSAPLNEAETTAISAPAPEIKTQPWVPHLLPLIESSKKVLPLKALRVLS